MKHTAVSALLLILALLAWAATPVNAQTGAGALREILPFEEVGAVDGTPFKIRVPANWSGTLLVYIQGTKGSTVTEPPLVPPVVPGTQPALEATLLSRGYALAAADVGSVDMQLKETVQDSLALTAYFRGRIGDPKRVILWGTSLGGLAVLKMIEDYPRSFDGGIATCAPAGGITKTMDRHFEIAVSYASVFGWPEEKWGSLGDLKEGLNFQRDVLPIANVPNADRSNFGAWGFIRLVRGISAEAFWGTNPVYNLQGWLMNLMFATGARAMNEVFAAGPFVQNKGRVYTLTSDEKAYLSRLGVNADDLLRKMNALANISAAPHSRDYMERYGSVRGLLRRPVLSLHNSMDNLSECAHESAYAEAVKWWGAEPYLYQSFAKAPGHCVFTSQQLLTAIGVMEGWLDTGNRPDTASFAEADGFDNAFTPPPWPH